MHLFRSWPGFLLGEALGGTALAILRSAVAGGAELILGHAALVKGPLVASRLGSCVLCVAAGMLGARQGEEICFGLGARAAVRSAVQVSLWFSPAWA